MNGRLTALFMTVTALFLFGCSKKENSPEPAAESALAVSPQKDVSPSGLSEPKGSVTTFDEVLNEWSSGQQARAVELFHQIRWDQPDLFAPDSIFRLSEAEFVKLSAAQREQMMPQALKRIGEVKALTKYIIQQAKEKGGYEATRTSLIECGKRLSGQDQLLLVQMVGKAVTEYTEKELPVW